MSNEELNANEEALLAEFDDLLADASTWVVPSADLEDRVVASIAAAQVSTGVAARVPRARRWVSTAGAAVVGAAAAAIATLALTQDDTPTRQADATVAMAGTDLAPGLTGDAAVTAGVSGVRIELKVPGLPRRDGGEFYQVWLKACDGSLLVPAGSFHEIDRAVAWAGVSTDDYPIISVTREVAAGPNDPAQGSSGEVVVAGTVSPCP